MTARPRKTRRLSVAHRRSTLRHPVPVEMVVRYECPECGDELDYHDGFACAPCGLEWGDQPNEEGALSDDWAEAAVRLFPAATLLDPVHLMHYRVDDKSWIMHLGGCPSLSWDRAEARCRFARRVGRLSTVLFESRFVIAEEAVTEADGFGGEPPRVVDASYRHRVHNTLGDNGLYLVDAGGPDERPLRVISLLARANSHGVVDPLNLRIDYPDGSRHGAMVRRRRAEDAAWYREDLARRAAREAARDAAREYVPDGPPSRIQTVELPPFTESGAPS